MADERDDFEGASAAAVAEAEDGGSPVPSDEPSPSSGYVVHDDLAAWITDVLTPKLTALSGRQDDLQRALDELRGLVDQLRQELHSRPGVDEYLETFNRAQAEHTQIHGEHEARLGVLEESMIRAEPQPAPAEPGA